MPRALTCRDMDRNSLRRSSVTLHRSTLAASMVPLHPKNVQLDGTVIIFLAIPVWYLQSGETIYPDCGGVAKNGSTWSASQGTSTLRFCEELYNAEMVIVITFRCFFVGVDPCILDLILIAAIRFTQIGTEATKQCSRDISLEHLGKQGSRKSGHLNCLCLDHSPWGYVLF